MAFTDKINKYKLDFHGVRLPEISVSDEDKEELGVSFDSDNYSYLLKLCETNLLKKISDNEINKNTEEQHRQQYKLELDLFKKHNLVDYVLLVYDFLNWSDKNDIARGRGRGSAGGSCVFFLLNCTGISPIEHKLSFSRFVSEARLQSKTVDGVVYLSGKSMPDFDADLSYYRRPEVISYIENKYKGKTCKIGTNICLTGKVLIKNCCKVYLGYSEEEALKISACVDRHFGKVEKISETYTNNEEFKEWVDSSDENKECFLIAKKLENLILARGQHPSGISISYCNVDGFIPLDLSSAKEPISSYDMENMAEFTVKIDALGLKNCDINHETGKLVGVNYRNVDINHPSIYDYLNRSNNYFGLFQIEDGLSKRGTLEIRPKNLSQLCCCLAISRPGVYIYLKQYLDYIRNGTLESIHPKIDEILKDTANIILYQELITKLCVGVYKMSEVDADQIRYCIGKKKKDEIKKWEPILFKHGLENNIPEEATKKVWETIIASADYQFSENHCRQYGANTAINTYFKANYSKEFFLSLLKMSKHEPDFAAVVREICKELPDFNIKLLPPHIIKSDLDFKIEGNDIRFGLSNLKSMGEKTIDKLIKFRGKYSSKFDIFQSAKECGLSIGHLSCLIQSGCLDDMLTQTRAKTVLEAQTWNLLTIKEKKYCLELGGSRKFDLLNLLKELNTVIKDEKGKPIIKDSRFGTIKKHYEPYKQIYLQNSKNEDLANYWFEKSLLGFSYSQSLKAIFEKKVQEIGGDIYNIREINETENLQEREVRFAAEVVEVKEFVARNSKKTKCLKLTVSDETGNLTVMIFNDKIDETHELNGRKFEEGDIIVVRGRKKKDCVFADTTAIQNLRIFTRLSDLKEVKEKM